MSDAERMQQAVKPMYALAADVTKRAPDTINQACQSISPLLTLFGHTPESYGSLIRQLGREINKTFAPRR